jgi:transcriptional regulator with XRE-family HTH domain
MAKRSTPLLVAFPEFKEKIQELRGIPPISQQTLARRLDVSQTQVSAWLSGAEKPSAENLIEMARIARTREGRLWFLKRAKVDLSTLKDDLWEQPADRIGQVHPHPTTVLPVIAGFSRDKDGLVVPQFSDREKFHISAECAEHPGDTVVLVVPSGQALLGGPPFPLSAGDFAVVDRTQRFPADFFDKEARLAC